MAREEASVIDTQAHAYFEAAVRPHIRRLYSLAYSILRERGEAEEAVQETMLSAWRSWDTVRSPEQPAPWLAKICTHHCLRRRTRLLKRRASDVELAADLGAGPTQLPFEGRFIDLDKAYRRLSVRQRAAIALHYHHGYEVAECADLMGCRPGTARSHLGRALAKLRKEMSDV